MRSLICLQRLSTSLRRIPSTNNTSPDGEGRSFNLCQQWHRKIGTLFITISTLSCQGKLKSVEITPFPDFYQKSNRQSLLIYNQTILNTNRSFCLSRNIWLVSHNYNRDTLLVQFGE